MEVLPLTRLASGRDLNLHVERRWMETVLQMQGPDGLLYYLKEGRPWWRVSCHGPGPPGEHYYSLYCGGRTLGAITVTYQLTADPVWREVGQRFVNGMTRLAIDRGDYASFAWIQYGPGGVLPPNVDPRYPPGYSMALWTLSNIAALAQFYRVAGYEPALTLARKLAHWTVDHGNPLGPDGLFLHEPIREGAHTDEAAAQTLGTRSYAPFHGHTIILLALLKYGLQVGDREILDSSCAGTGTAGPTGSRWWVTSEMLDWPDFEGCETCCTADMVALALKLSSAGLGDYWDDADRWIRNQLVENQMTRADWAEQMWEMGAAHLRDWDIKPSQLDPVTRAPTGCWSAMSAASPPHATANDFSTGKTAITACCTGNGARTLYQAWEHILDYADGRLKVNLLLNRASAWADVDSYIPYEGCVDLSVRRDSELSMRIPEWVKPEQVVCRMDDVECPVGWKGRCAHVGQVEAGQVVALNFPLSERLDRVYVQNHRCTLTRKGNDVVSIHPGGQYLPLYQREHYRHRDVRWRRIERSVPEKLVSW